MLAIACLSAAFAAPAGAQPAPAFPPTAAHGQTIAVSALVAPPELASADVGAQVDAIIAELSRRLAAAESALGHVVSTTVYLERAADFPRLNEAWRRAWPSSPPTRTTVVADVPAPGALVMVSAIALRTGSERVVIQPQAWPAPPSPYSYAIRSGDTLYLSGIVPRRGADNTAVTGDMRVQTTAVLDNARVILDAAGFTFADVVSARVFITDVAAFPPMNDVYRSYFPAAPPARATVRTGLTHPDYLVEITLTAVRSGDRAVLTTPAADGTPGRPNPNLSSAIRAGRTLYLAGMLGVTPGSEHNLEAQTAETLARLERTMALGGFAWSNVYDSVIYVTDARSVDAVARALAAKTGGTLPAGTAVVTGLVSVEGVVEIMLTAGKQE